MQESPTGQGTAQFQNNRQDAPVQRKVRAGMAESPRHQSSAQLRNAMQSPSSGSPIGLPDQLKAGLESLSGIAMDDVKVHFNSSKPAQLKANAFAQGSEIHLARGQEKHLAHEAWHVVQQKQGRVRPTTQFKGKVDVNDEIGLEREADVMGARAVNLGATAQVGNAPVQRVAQGAVAQCDFGDELMLSMEKFWEKFDEMIEEGKREHGGSPFRLLKISELLEAADPEVEMGFWSVIHNENPAKLTVIAEMIHHELKRRLGYEEVEELKRTLLNPAGWGNLDFKTNGFNNIGVGFVRYQHPDIYKGMLAKYGNNPKGEGFLKGLIRSGADTPWKKDVEKGDKFYKLMPPGPKTQFQDSFSSYYLTWEEIQTILRGDNLADHLGLPVLNYAAAYGVYEIEALKDTEVYQSTIAPTEQKIKTPQKTVRNQGGRIQTMIIDSNDKEVWRKNPKPVYLLDPDEIELRALQAYIDQ